MAKDDNGAEAIGALLVLVMIVMAVVAAVAALMSAGAVYGAGTALYNYGVSLRESIQPERAAV
ncbi:MAG TPA: hypothetical protein VFJ16_18795 [Longimicrobium sp.]|nr:hypothetical protein [Longimicrobium sp.]